MLFGECGSELCEPSRGALDDHDAAEPATFAGVLAALGLGGSIADSRRGGAGERRCSEPDDDDDVSLDGGLRIKFRSACVSSLDSVANTAATCSKFEKFSPERKCAPKRAPGTVVGTFVLRNPSAQALKEDARGRAKSDATETELAVRQTHGRVQHALHAAAEAACRSSSLGGHIEKDVVEANEVDRLRLLQTK